MRMNDLIRAKDANIYWRYSHNGKVYDVRVRDKFSECEKRFTTSGACDAGWRHRRASDPEALFGEMLFRYGFINREESRMALLQFAKIDSCNWAREMLEARMYGSAA